MASYGDKRPAPAAAFSDLTRPAAKRIRKNVKFSPVPAGVEVLVISDDDTAARVNVEQNAPPVGDKDLGPLDEVDSEDDPVDDEWVDSDDSDAEDEDDDLPLVEDEGLASTISLIDTAPEGEVPVAEEYVLRFQALLRAMIRFIHNWARSPAYAKNAAAKRGGRAISQGFANHFRRHSHEAIFQAAITIIPTRVQTILGAPDLDASHLLSLPAIPAQGHLWGVYVDAASLVGQPQPPVVGGYVGSSVAVDSYPGIRGRVAQHLHKSVQDFDTLREKDRSRHYAMICRKDVRPNFRSLALTATDDAQRVVVVLMEGLLAAYLNTITTTPSMYNPVAAVRFIKDMRQYVNKSGHGTLPDFGRLGLNGASPLFQGWVNPAHPKRRAHREWAETHPDICGNPVCKRPRPEKYHWPTWVGFKEASRCPGCAKYLAEHGVEHPRPKASFSREQHQEWLKDPANKDVCSVCGDPRPEGAVNWRGWGPQARCSRCRKPDQSTRRTTTFREHTIWLEKTGNPDVCFECKAKRPVDYEGWVGFCEKARCPACLSRARREAKKANPKTPTGPTTPKPTIETHRAWLKKTGKPDVCNVCKASRPPDPRDARKRGWRNFFEDAVCGSCRNKQLRAAKARTPASTA